MSEQSTAAELREHLAFFRKHFSPYVNTEMYEGGCYDLCRFCSRPPSKFHAPDCRWRLAMEASADLTEPFREPMIDGQIGPGITERLRISKKRAEAASAAPEADATKKVEEPKSCRTCGATLSPDMDSYRSNSTLCLVCDEAVEREATQPAALDLAGIRERWQKAAGHLPQPKIADGAWAMGTEAANEVAEVVAVDHPALIAEVERLGDEADLLQDGWLRAEEKAEQDKQMMEKQAATIVKFEVEARQLRRRLADYSSLCLEKANEITAQAATIARLEKANKGWEEAAEILAAEMDQLRKTLEDIKAGRVVDHEEVERMVADGK